MIWKPHVVAATVVEREGAFLCVEEDIDGAVVINQPAGHLDAGEDLISAAARETVEETGWTVEVVDLIGIYLLEASAKTFLRFCFAARPRAFDPARPLDAEIVRTHWFTPAQLAAQRPRHRSPLVMQAVDDYLSGQRYPLSILHDRLRA